MLYFILIYSLLSKKQIVFGNNFEITSFYKFFTVIKLLFPIYFDLYRKKG